MLQPGRFTVAVRFFWHFIRLLVRRRWAPGLKTLEDATEIPSSAAHDLAGYSEDAVHSLKGLPHVVDVRNLGLIGAIELEAIPGEATRRGFSAFLAAFEKGLLIRTTGDIIALSPPLIISRGEIDLIIETLSGVLKGLA